MEMKLLGLYEYKGWGIKKNFLMFYLNNLCIKNFFFVVKNNCKWNDFNWVVVLFIDMIKIIFYNSGSI